MTRPILYSFRRCPYAMRARMALAASGEVCALREVVLRDKPAAMLQASPKGSVPVLVLADGAVVDESLDIMLWTLRRRDPQNWLTPERGDLDEMLALIAANDGPFKHALDRYKYPNRYDNVDPKDERATGLAWLMELSARLDDADYLFGSRPSLADIAIFPFVRQFANTDRDWFDQVIPATLLQWLETWLASEQFTSIMRKYPVWAPGEKELLFSNMVDPSAIS
ncbi:MAG: glutathione S-transferase [Pseudomonadota bacterium]